MNKTFPLFAILSSALYLNANAHDKIINKEILLAQNEEQKNHQEKIDPTQDVAGGLGEKGYSAPKYAVLPTGKTLPKGIFKIDTALVYSFGNQGFDSNGSQVDNGLTYKRWITGAQIQYGLSNSVSLGIGTIFPEDIHNTPSS